MQRIRKGPRGKCLRAEGCRRDESQSCQKLVFKHTGGVTGADPYIVNIYDTPLLYGGLEDATQRRVTRTGSSPSCTTFIDSFEKRPRRAPWFTTMPDCGDHVTEDENKTWAVVNSFTGYVHLPPLISLSTMSAWSGVDPCLRVRSAVMSMEVENTFLVSSRLLAGPPTNPAAAYIGGGPPFKWHFSILRYVRRAPRIRFLLLGISVLFHYSYKPKTNELGSRFVMILCTTQEELMSYLAISHKMERSMRQECSTIDKLLTSHDRPVMLAQRNRL